MSRRPAVPAVQAARAVRGLLPDRNPLRRRLDRVEAAIVAGLAIAFLAGAPPAATAVGHLAYQAVSQTVHAERSWHEVRAVLLAAAPASWGGKGATIVRARWAAPGQARRTGAVPAWPGAKAGSTVLVWVDAAGRLTGPPVRAAAVRAQALLAAVFAVILLGLVLTCAGLLAHGTLGRRRLAAWDADWQATEPRWSGRR